MNALPTDPLFASSQALEQPLRLGQRTVYLAQRDGVLAAGAALRRGRCASLSPRRQGGVSLAVLGPRPRVYLNGQRVMPGRVKRVRAGDVVQIGANLVWVRASEPMRRLRKEVAVVAASAVAALLVALQLLNSPLEAPALGRVGEAPSPTAPSRVDLALDEAASLARVGGMDCALTVLELAEQEFAAGARPPEPPRPEPTPAAVEPAAPRTLPASFRPSPALVRTRPEPRLALEPARSVGPVLNPTGQALPPVATEALIACFDRGDRGASAARAELLRRGVDALPELEASIAASPRSTWLAVLRDEIQAQEPSGD